jgi:hypothetical protein
VNILKKNPRRDGIAANDGEQFNVAIIAIDSTARNQFVRHMPLTLEFMTENEFETLNGYNKVIAFLV